MSEPMDMADALRDPAGFVAGMTETVTVRKVRNHDEGQRYHVYVIRRGWEYWTGTRFALGVYEARCYGFLNTAMDVVRSRKLAVGSDDPVQVVACVMAIGVPEETVAAIAKATP